MSTDLSPLKLTTTEEVTDSSSNNPSAATATAPSKKKNKIGPLGAKLSVDTTSARLAEYDLLTVPQTPLAKNVSYSDVLTSEALDTIQTTTSTSTELDFANNLSSPTTPAVFTDATTTTCPLISITSSSPSASSDPVVEKTDATTASVSATRIPLPSLKSDVESCLNHGTLVSTRVANSFLASLFNVCNSAGDENIVAEMRKDYIEAQQLIFEHIVNDARAAQATAAPKKTIDMNRARDAFKLRYANYILPPFLNKQEK